MAVSVSLRGDCMRGYKHVVVFDCANSPIVFQMFTQHKFVIGFCIDTKGQVQATSKVKCQLMTFMATIIS